MNLLLDTNVISKIMSSRFPSYRAGAQASRLRGERHLASVISVHELVYGAAKSEQPVIMMQRVRAVLDGLDDIYPFIHEDAELAGELRFKLTRSGKMIGPYDLFLAAQAQRLDATLVTNNTKEFSQVSGLRLCDWNS